MCGIAGFKCFGLEKPTKKELEALFVGIMDRGKDATGIAFFIKNHLQVIKEDITALEFIKKDAWKTLQVPTMMIMHARQKTTGDAKDNQNNHPIFNKSGMALVHNGILYNEKDIYRELNIEPDAEVDSEILLHLIENNWWKDIKNINKVQGGYACAVIYEKYPEELILFKNNNPICYYMDKDRDIIFFASTKEILENAIGKLYRGFKVGISGFYELPDDKAYLINSSGLIDVVSLTPKTWRNYSSYDDKDTPHKAYKNQFGNHKKSSKKKSECRALENNWKGNIYGNCHMCRRWMLLKGTKIGDICIDCAEVFLSCNKTDENEYECPWCYNQITAFDVQRGKCSECDNPIEFK